MHVPDKIIMNQKGNVIGVAVANYGKKAGVESFNFGIKSSTLKTFASANGLSFLPPNNKELSKSKLLQPQDKRTQRFSKLVSYLEGLYKEIYFLRSFYYLSSKLLSFKR